MTTKPTFVANLGRVLDGLAYAELGEYLSQQDKEMVLGATGLHRPVAPSATSEPQAYRRIALAAQGRVWPGALHYAHNACERLDADLDILTDQTEGGLGAVIVSERERLAQGGHRLEIVRLGRDLLRGVARYADARSGLLFVVVSADDAVAERVITGRGASRHLEVPWVVVTSANAA